jgi:hypothetical protein
MEGEEKREIIRTSCPFFRKKGIRWLPTKPVPPVIAIFISRPLCSIIDGTRNTFHLLGGFPCIPYNGNTEEGLAGAQAHLMRAEAGIPEADPAVHRVLAAAAAVEAVKSFFLVKVL